MSLRSKMTLFLLATLTGFGAGPTNAQQLTLSIAPAYQEIDRPSDPFAGLDLGGGFIEFLLTGRLVSERMSQSPLPMTFLAVQPVPEGSPTTAVGVVPYGGPIAPGSVVLNATRNRVYRILPYGWMEAYPENTDIATVLKSRLASVD